MELQLSDEHSVDNPLPPSSLAYCLLRLLSQVTHSSSVCRSAWQQLHETWPLVFSSFDLTLLLLLLLFSRRKKKHICELRLAFFSFFFAPGYFFVLVRGWWDGVGGVRSQGNYFCSHSRRSDRWHLGHQLISPNVASLSAPSRPVARYAISHYGMLLTGFLPWGASSFFFFFCNVRLVRATTSLKAAA